MARDFVRAFYNSKEWQQCRAAYIEYVHGLCERCKRPGWIVHHKIYLTQDNIDDTSVTLNFDNLEYLCQDCHNREHKGRDYKSVKEGLYFDENGDLKQCEAPPIEEGQGARNPYRR